jgi:amino acid transporter
MAVASGQTTRRPSRAIGRVVAEERGLRRDVGRIGLLFAGVGSIIGSGWLFGALTASTIAGPAAIVSWLLGGVMVMLIGVCYAELGAMLPVSGGVVRYPHYSFGSLTSYTGGWITWVAAVTTAPIEVLATLTYATNYVPWLTDERGGVPVLTPAGTRRPSRSCSSSASSTPSACGRSRASTRRSCGGSWPSSRS